MLIREAQASANHTAFRSGAIFGFAALFIVTFLMPRGRASMSSQRDLADSETAVVPAPPNTGDSASSAARKP